jgi:hypothetical protein
MVEQINLLLFAGAMSADLKRDMLDAVASIEGRGDTQNLNRVQMAVFMALAAPEYLVQR